MHGELVGKHGEGEHLNVLGIKTIITLQISS